MLPWKSIIQIQKDNDMPVYLQIAGAMALEIKRGHVGPGVKLPGTRLLSEMLAIHRKTIVRAYEELAAQGWIEMRASQGSFTSREIPEINPRRFTDKQQKLNSFPAETGYPIRSQLLVKTPSQPLRHIPGFHDGPDPRLMPSYELAKAYRSVLSKKVNLRYTSYVEVPGVEKFRKILSDYLNSSRGLQTTFENVLITRGSTMGLYLIVNTLFSKKDIVIVGDTNYYYADHAFLNAGMQLMRVSVDDFGIDVDAIEKICRKKKISAVFITSHHHYPTTVTLSASRRMKLLSLAEQFGFVIIEDDYDYDFHYLSSPILPLVSADSKGMVIYIGNLSKTISPAIRVGYVIAPVNLIQELGRLRQLIDAQGDPIMELALADLFQDGSIRRHMKKALQEYHRRRDFVSAALCEQLAGKIDFRVPDGGLAIWAKFHPAIPLPLLSQKMKDQGIILSNGLIHNTGSTSLNATRIGFGWMNEKEAERAIDMLISTIGSMVKR
ncbi:MAG TPA: PLP-dependent aminotransferase family protein [Puia sp.]|jgi:GntR family transcriptional regulator/MocR family aminotransferase|nr:PLP-dependent aminotransferase family protein [Puia sp.]